MLKDLIRQAIDVLDHKDPPDENLMTAENALSAFLEAIATERITEPVDITDMEHAQRLLREIRRQRSRRLVTNQQNTNQEKTTKDDDSEIKQPESSVVISPHLEDDDSYDPLKKFLSSSHDPEAEGLMDEAEEAFYAGNYQKAIPLFEKVLQIEPGWSRAQEHRDEAEDFLRSGNIPSVALPPEAGKAYGKAQSAARVFRYQTALDYLDEAFNTLKQAGINRWREGEELRQDLENQMQANEVYQEGLSILRQGDLQGAYTKIQTAANAVALPEYIDKASEIRDDISSMEEINDVINLSGSIPPEKMAEARSKLELLAIKYGEIPQITRVRNRMDIILPAVAAALIDQIQRLKRQGDAANTLKTAKEAYAAADSSLTTFQTLKPGDEEKQNLQAEIQESQQEIEDLEDSLQRANQALNNENRFFPRNAHSISKNVRTRFPEDPEVLALKNRMRWYPVTLYGGGAIAGILVILLLWLGGRGIAGIIGARQLAMMPTATATATITPIPTITLTPTETGTPTPEASETPDFTPTPTPIVLATVNRDLFIREQCYETELAVGRAPEGSVVTIIALPQRVFDNLNRECVLVEYRPEGRTITGYILLLDLTIE